MRFSRTSKALGLAVLAALALSACGGGSTNGGGSAGGDADPKGIVRAYSNEPQNPLLPGQTNEVFGGRVVDLLFAGLVSYDSSGKTVNELAESIESSDSQNYTIKIKSGQKFTNGEAITAKTFVDSWNFEALSTNGQSNGSFFSSLEGYDAVSATTGTGDNAKPAPKAQTMSGLKVVDDTTFTVKLKQPESDWTQRLGYTVFFPLPSEAMKDPKKFGQSPIGNGPYKMAGADAWQHDKQIALVKNDDYKGPREAKNGGVTFAFYTNSDAAYTDIQGNSLDVLDVIPSTALATFQQDLDGRAANKPSALNGTLNIPVYLPEFQGEAGSLRRQAISHAIDRAQITKVIFHDTRTPAKEFTVPSMLGYDANIPGSDVLNFDAAKAKDLWAQADKIKPWDASKSFTIAYNTDGGNKEWVDAVANQLKNNLGIKAEGKPYPKFATMLDDRLNRKLTGAVRAGWQADYPSIYNFLEPTLGTNGSSNYEKYSNPEFDKLLLEGEAAKTPEEGAKIFNKAQEILFKDLPNIPLWSQNQPIGWSTSVNNVETDWHGVIEYYKVTKNK